MGQYHLVVNLDKNEYLHPHQLGDGLKLMEQAMSGPGGTGSALLLLLACSNGRGGGDFHSDEFGDVIGRWAGDRIAVVGDYAEQGDIHPEDVAHTIYGRCDTPEGVADHVAHLRKLAVDPSWPSERRELFAAEADLIERLPILTNITPRVREALESEGMRYSGDGWMDRELVGW